MPGHGAFTTLRAFLLLLLGVRGSRDNVPPPANVTVSCHNGTVIASWDYSQRLQTSFTVIINGSAGSCKIEPIGHRGDLSKFIWESEERYYAFHQVTVTAVQGGKKSLPATNTFSFNYLKSVQTTCFLDFPRVAVDMGKSEATVSFLNPIHLYGPLKKTVNIKSPPTFKFTVSPVRNGTKHGGDFTEECPHTNHTCKLTMSLIDGDQKCFELSGNLFDSLGINYVKFRETGTVCGLYSDEENILILAGILTCVIVVLIIVVGLLICKTKAWTMKTPNMPQFLKEVPQHKQKQPRCSPETTKEELIHVNICGPSKSLSDSSEDGDPPQNQRLLAGDEVHHREDAGDEDHHREDAKDAQLLESSEQELISAQSDEDGGVSPYDRPQIISLDIGDGDFVTAYTGK